MHEFDAYIDSIIGNLSISEKKKYEMADEYRDHLEMLKQDYIKEGLEEEDAVKEAIKSFGDSRELKVKLSNNILGYRSIPNVVFGIVFTILIFVVGSSPSNLPGLSFQDGQVSITGITTNDFIIYSYIYLTIIIPYILMFIPVGYFLPIIFKRAGKMKNTALAALLPSLIIGIVSNLRLLQTGFNYWTVVGGSIVSTVIGGLLGSILGFAILRITSKVSLSFRYSR
ncbi:MAG TPA: permease prefix domain 1-containing protein [Ruminiclostridium sp.]